MYMYVTLTCVGCSAGGPISDDSSLSTVVSSYVRGMQWEVHDIEASITSLVGRAGVKPHTTEFYAF